MHVLVPVTTPGTIGKLGNAIMSTTLEASILMPVREESCY